MWLGRAYNSQIWRDKTSRMWNVWRSGAWSEEAQVWAGSCTLGGGICFRSRALQWQGTHPVQEGCCLGVDSGVLQAAGAGEAGPDSQLAMHTDLQNRNQFYETTKARDQATLFGTRRENSLDLCVRENGIVQFHRDSDSTSL